MPWLPDVQADDAVGLCRVRCPQSAYYGGRCGWIVDVVSGVSNLIRRITATAEGNLPIANQQGISIITSYLGDSLIPRLWFSTLFRAGFNRVCS